MSTSSPPSKSRRSSEKLEKSPSASLLRRVETTSQLRTSEVQQALQNYHNIILKLVILSNVVDKLNSEILKQFICQRCNSAECCNSRRSTPDVAQDPELREAAVCGLMLDDGLGPIEQDGIILARLANERHNEDSLIGPLMRRVGMKKDKDKGQETDKTIGAVERWVNSSQVEERFTPFIEEVGLRIGCLEKRLRKKGVLTRGWDREINEEYGLK